MRHAAFAAACGAVLAGCAAPSAPATWPDDLPPREACVRAWGKDPENRKLQTLDQYLAWVRLFYSGTALAPGWTAASRSLLGDVPEDDRPALLPRLEGLGRLLSADWAKDNRLRRVNNGLLSLWGAALKRARAARCVRDTVDRIDGDARALLAGTLRAAEITPARYAEPPFARESRPAPGP